MKVTIDCETCGGEGGIWKGGTIPVACPAECDNGQVTLEGDDATDELERREIAKRKAAERRATQPPATYPSARLTPEERREVEQRAEVAQLAAEGRSGSLARPASPAAWPFDVALEASRDSRASRTNAHPATVAASAYFQANPTAGFEKRVGGFSYLPKFTAVEALCA